MRERVSEWVTLGRRVMLWMREHLEMMGAIARQASSSREVALSRKGAHVRKGGGCRLDASQLHSVKMDTSVAWSDPSQPSTTLVEGALQTSQQEKCVPLEISGRGGEPGHAQR
jgi:hypothetical protein